MHWHCSMGGCQQGLSLNALVGGPSPWSTLCLARRGGFPTLHHNEVHDFTTSLMLKVCSGVSIEPGLLQLNGKQFMGASAIRDDRARLDMAANGFWGANRECAFLM